MCSVCCGVHTARPCAEAVECMGSETRSVTMVLAQQLVCMEGGVVGAGGGGGV